MKETIQEDIRRLRLKMAELRGLYLIYQIEKDYPWALECTHSMKCILEMIEELQIELGRQA